MTFNLLTLQNGDGWGELEFTGFTSLHFAACNGHVETCRLLLEAGADVKVTAGWDGGHFCPIPFCGSSDYWYTESNTALHQAARGNYTQVIELILNGPPKGTAANSPLHTS